ncbi:hypothetical protein F5B20DRAFT_563190 [Whalleya microplaca]|nr:hypothetical protein F5B20DRAFT_563190 [Whalleya microplaca]
MSTAPFSHFQPPGRVLHTVTSLLFSTGAFIIPVRVLCTMFPYYVSEIPTFPQIRKTALSMARGHCLERSHQHRLAIITVTSTSYTHTYTYTYTYT